MLLILGKGGVGRTTTTALLAHGAHAAGLKVLVHHFIGCVLMRSMFGRYLRVLRSRITCLTKVLGTSLADLHSRA